MIARPDQLKQHLNRTCLAMWSQLKVIKNSTRCCKLKKYNNRCETKWLKSIGLEKAPKLFLSHQLYAQLEHFVKITQHFSVTLKSWSSLHSSDHPDAWGNRRCSKRVVQSQPSSPLRRLTPLGGHGKRSSSSCFRGTPKKQTLNNRCHLLAVKPPLQ